MRTFMKPSIVGALLLVGLARCGNTDHAQRAEGGKADSVHSHALDLRLRDVAKQTTGRDERVATVATVLEVGAASVTIETDPVVIDLPADHSVKIDLPEPWTQGLIAANRAFQVDEYLGGEWRPFVRDYLKELRLTGEGRATGQGAYFTGERFLGEEQVRVRDMMAISDSRGRELEPPHPRRIRVKALPIGKWGDWIVGDRFGTTIRLRYRCERGRLTVHNGGGAAMTLTHAGIDDGTPCDLCTTMPMLAGQWWALAPVTIEPGQEVAFNVSHVVTQLYLDDGSPSILGDQIHGVALDPSDSGCACEVTLD